MILESVQRTGALAIVEDAIRSQSLGMQIVDELATDLFSKMTSLNMPTGREDGRRRRCHSGHQIVACDGRGSWEIPGPRAEGAVELGVAALDIEIGALAVMLCDLLAPSTAFRALATAAVSETRAPPSVRTQVLSPVSASSHAYRADWAIGGVSRILSSGSVVGLRRPIDRLAHDEHAARRAPCTSRCRRRRRIDPDDEAPTHRSVPADVQLGDHMEVGVGDELDLALQAQPREVPSPAP